MMKRIIHDFLCYNTHVNLADLLKKSLDSVLLDLIRRIADESSALGFPTYLVGGSVRDLMLARPIVDLDLTLEGDAIKLGRALIKKYGGELTAHERFHTATWTFTHPVSSLQSLDLISARRETYSHPGALPTVTKSTIDDDLRRRDFTINAMAIRVDGDHFGELHDPLHGQADLEKKLIRFLHKRSFIDDPTRMFRALRYSVRYQFSIEPETRDALFDNEARVALSQLSGERIRHEFDMIFEEDRPLLALAALEDGSGLTNVIHPSFQNVRAMAVSYLDDAPEEGFGEFAIPEILSLRQSLGWILYLMILSTDEIDSIAERLAFPVLLTKSVRAASSLLHGLPSFKGWKPSRWTFHLDELPTLAIYAVYSVQKDQALHDYLVKWQYVKPHTTGDDLKARGLEPGPRFGEILRRLRAAWLDGEVKTKEEEEMMLKGLIS
jgi:tRNA nucleotidyltransferase (CCA-adding enzyme)